MLASLAIQGDESRTWVSYFGPPITIFILYENRKTRISTALGGAIYIGADSHFNPELLDYGYSSLLRSGIVNRLSTSR